VPEATDIEASTIGLTVRFAVLLLPYALAETVTVAADETTFEVTVKLAVVAPAATVTETGAVAALVLLLERFTTAPPAGAAAASVTVPVAFAVPPITAVGLIAKLASDTR
jgi:hypothetical protein